MDTTEPSAPPPTRAGRREWVGLAVLILPVLLISMSVTVMNFAVPHLGADLQPSGTELLWIIDIYTFLLAGMLLTMGSLGDRIGRRRLLLMGAAAFGAASAASAFATSPAMLIAARAVLGVAGATLMPATLALIRTLFDDPAQRKMAIGLWTGGFIGGTAIGPLGGGILLEFFWWGSLFLVNVPVMVVLLLTAPFLLPESKGDQKGRLDFLSAVLSVAAVIPVVYGIKQFSENGLTWTAAGSVVLGLVVGAWLVFRQLRLSDPLIDVRLFRNPAFSVGALTVMLGVFSLVGFMYFVSQYLQLVLGLRPITAGLWMLPMVAMSATGAALSVALSMRIHPGRVVGLALVLGTGGMLTLTRVGPDTGIALLLVGMGMVGAGMGAIASICTDLVVASAPRRSAGSAASLSEAAGELGGALGIAILGSIGMAVYRSGVSAEAPEDAPPEVAEAIQETLPGAVAISEHLPAEAGEQVREVAFRAFTEGMQSAALSGALILAVTAVLVFGVLSRIPKDDLVGEHDM
ncbi:MFS transporter [Nocardiopsis suaedae]|uniref:MFS transporter n=1 Tax=Nocardiopsis suaedae TaxID=3018444 RepID=A0ABT4TGW2_9ACTN|nr:MFS transporter [Nocardiopsis suaedae]MDA2803630.1 MFS transporter [Nocardiopsis suaedae]